MASGRVPKTARTVRLTASPGMDGASMRRGLSSFQERPERACERLGDELVAGGAQMAEVNEVLPIGGYRGRDVAHRHPLLMGETDERRVLRVDDLPSHVGADETVGHPGSEALPDLLAV